jgi:lipopolysaccharide export system permease protein
MRLGMPRALDRYVFFEWLKIFVTTALGFPILTIVIDLTDNLEKYLGRNLSREAIALSYMYWLPESMFLVLPAAVLFATVFSIGAFTRHAEVTAAKASGISFYRLIAPILAGAALAAVFTLALGEVVPMANAKRADLLEEDKATQGTDRYNFVYAAEGGRVYKAGSLSVPNAQMGNFQIERKGSGPAYPTLVVSALAAKWKPRIGWMLHKGSAHIISDNGPDIAIGFDSLHDKAMKEAPTDLLASSRSPHEMGYRDLSRFIKALERSGGDTNELKVERALKIAIPLACLVIALFGAPLATSTQRGGAAYGIGVSLATTIIYLMMIQLTKAVGGKGLLPPDLAAWLPNVIFAVAGVVLLSRTRT